jgi:hypothetical protein
MVVSLENLSSYVSLVSHWLLVEGVSTQMEAVREGFTSVFPIASLQMFYPGTVPYTALQQYLACTVAGALCF